MLSVIFNEICLRETVFAKIAQLVEHDLAKVGVAGSSPVFRSKDARMVELVDTQDLKSCGHCGRVGSSPTSGTKSPVSFMLTGLFTLRAVLFVLLLRLLGFFNQ